MSFQRRKVLRILLQNGVTILREGAGHTILRGPTGRQSSLGRHQELNRITVRKMIKQLGLNADDLYKEMQ
jgi:predicted RNA binding protein YcfA (HicA-like mRNA interferase family)